VVSRTDGGEVTADVLLAVVHEAETPDECRRRLEGDDHRCAVGVTE
jgi:hypothetical protein